MVYSPRIGPDGAFAREFTDLKRDVRSLETRPAGKIVIRETLTTTDPETGVKTIVGQLPDGSYGIQPFVYDITPPPVATAPVVAVEPGIFTISWDGLFADNAEMPRDFECVNIIGHKMNGAATVSSEALGMIVRPLDITYVTQEKCAPGETWQFSLESEDYNGNRAAWGARSASMTMMSIVSDEGITAALEGLQEDADAAAQAAFDAQDAAQSAQDDADAAAAAALAASNLAGTKGKVLIQSATPAVGDQLAQNLWIDTTGGTNTPKRWNGSAWVVVTDKVATDAAAAAAAAQTKADQAFNNAATAATAAGNAQTTADGKNRNWYQTTAPAGTSHKNGDQWFDTDDGNKLYLWTGAAWVAFQDAAIAAAQGTANTALTSANGKNKNYYQTTQPSGGTYIAGDLWFDTDDNYKMYTYTGSIWQVTQDAAGALAQANTKNRTFIQGTAPTAFAAGDLWIDTASGNQIKRWSGSAWVDARDTTIAAAQGTATTALTSANGKNRVYYQTTMPTGGTYILGDTWFDTDDGNKIYVHNGTTFIASQDAAIGTAQTAANNAQSTANSALTTANSKTKTYFQTASPGTTGNTTGDIWFDTDDGNKVYVWNGTAWTIAQDAAIAAAQTSANGKNKNYYQTTQPSGGTYITGDLWFDTDDNYKMYTYTGSTWQVTQDSATALSTANTKSKTYFQTAQPGMSGNTVGDTWFDTDDGNKPYVWNGLAWVSAQDAAISAAQGTANTALTSANGKNKVYYQTAMPTGGTYITGDTWFDTDDGNKIYVHNGTTFVNAQDAAIATAQAAAVAAQGTANTGLSTANSKTKTYFQTSSPGTTGNTTGDIWFDTDDGNKVYVWNGSAWTVAQDAAISAAQTSANGKTTTFYQTATPSTSGRVTGDTWFDTDDGNKIYVWNGSAWTASQDASIAAAQTTANSKTKTFTQGTTPTATTVGDVWIDTANGNLIKVWSGSAWTSYQDAAIATAQAAANTAQTSANGKNKVYYQTAMPTGGTYIVGDTWFDTDDGNKIYVHNGTTFVNAQDTAIATAQSAATGAQGTANTALTTANLKTKTYFQSTSPGTSGNTSGDIWFDTGNGNKVYVWNGTAWTNAQDAAITAAQTSANGKATIFYQTTAPSATGRVVGDTWFDTDDGNKIYVWNGSAWTNSQDAAIAAAQTTANSKTKTFIQGTAPTATTVGDIWIDTANGNVIKTWEGSSWVTSADAAIAAAQTQANTALTSANGKNKTYYQTAMPTGGTYIVGDTWFDTDDGNKIYVHNGTTFVNAQDTAIATAQSAATGAQGTANTALTTANLKTKTYFQTAQPGTTGNTVGDMWFDTDDSNKVYVWNGASWASARDAGIASAASAAATAQSAADSALSAAQAAQAVADGSIRTWYQASAPTGLNGTSDIGDLWFDTDDGQAYRWNGTAWVIIEDNSIAAALAAAQNAQTTADGKITSYYQPGQPATGEVGDLWFDTDDKNKPYYCSSISPLTWTVVRDGTIADAQTTANTALTSANGKNRVFYQTAMPTGSFITGDTWFDTDDGNKIYVYNGTTFVNAQDTAIATAQSTANTKTKTYFQTASPGTSGNTTGDIWFDTDDGNKPYVWNGSAWTSAQDATIASAQGTANTALTSANGKNRTYYQTTMPSGGTYILGDTWFDTDDGNKIYVHNGTTFVASQDASIATAQTAANNAQTTANGKTKTFIQGTAPTATTTGDIWIDTANGNVLKTWEGSSWVTRADAAIATAQTAANTAQTSANGKNTVFYQGTSPSTSGRVTGDTWFDTANGYRVSVWNGSAWTLSQDTSIATAQSTANTANTTANSKTKTFIQGTAPTATTTGDIWIDTANGNVLKTWEGSSWVTRADAAIAAAQTAANNAQTSANGRNKIYYQTAQPSGGTYILGDTWFDTDDGNKIYVHNGTTWIASALGSNAIADLAITNAKIADATIQSAKIGSVDAGTITVGTLNAARIGADSITATHIASDAITANELAAGSITAAKGQISDLAVTTAKINDAAITTAKIANLAVTNAQIADATIQAAKIGSVDAGTITVGTLSANRIGADTITSAHIAADAITSTELAAGSITAAKGQISDLAITTAKIQDAAITTAKIANLAVTNAQIADATIASAKIASLDAGKITTGYLNSARIDAGTISTTQLLISDTTNLVEDAELGGNGWYRRSGAVGASTLVTTVGLPGRSWKLDGVGTEVSVATLAYFSVEPGSQYFVSLKAQNALTGAGPSAYMRIYWFTETGAASAVTNNSSFTIGVSGWGITSGTVVAPSDARRGVFTAIHGASATGGSWWFGMPTVRRKNEGSLIVDGAITAGSAIIATGAIGTAQIGDAQITTAKIANLAVTDAQIAAATITSAKIASLDAAKITTGTLDANRIGADTITATHIASDAITANELAANSITAAKGQISDAAITTAKIADAQITTAKIALLAVTDAQIASATITSAKIASLDAGKITTGTLDANRIGADTITAVHIASNTITSTEMVAGTITAASGIIADAAITTAKIANLAVTDAQIAAATITSAKIANLDAAKITTGTLDANRIGADTITATHIASDAITANELAANSITAAKGQISDLAITTAKIQDAAITTAKIANLAVTNAQIADATIASAKIANLDAAKITTGTLDANRIAAGSVTADKIAVGDFTDLVDNGTFETDFLGWATASATITTTTPYSGTKSALFTGGNSIVQARGINVTPGEKLLVSVWYKASADKAGPGGIRLRNQSGAEGATYNISSDVGTATAWTNYTVIATVSAGTTVLYPRFAFALTAGSVQIDNYSIRRMTSATLIEPGAITTNSAIIANGAIGTAQIGDAQITTAKIANLAVTNAQIADATIQAAKIGSVDAGTITVGTLSANRIGADTITSAHIAADAITSNELAANSITAAKGQIADLAVTTAKIADAQITTAKIALLAVTDAQIAAATITSAKIANLDAAKITSGTIDANRIGANTITANKLFVGDLTNLAADGNFVDANKLSWTGSGTVTLVAGEPNRLRVVTAASGNNDQKNINTVQVTPGEQIYMECYVYGEPANVGGGGPNIHVVVQDNTGAYTWPIAATLTRAAVSGAWTKLSGSVTIPANAKTATVELAVTYSADAVGNIYYFREVSVRRKATGSLIVDGAITAGSAIIATGAIGTAQIGDAQITTAKIAALAVGNAQIADAAIDNAKIANIDAGKINAGTISAARIGADTITSTHIASDAITANELAANSITAAKGQISDLAITTAKIQDAAITTAKIANLAVTNAQIADATIASAKISALDAGKITTGTLDANRIGVDTITASHIASNTITSTEMVAGTITAASGIIADAAITTAKIADLAVTDAKISTLNAGKITAGLLDAARIDAGTIGADKLLVSNSTNVLVDPNFSVTNINTVRLTNSSGGTGGWTVNAGTSTGLRSLVRVTTTTNDQLQLAPFTNATGKAAQAIQVEAGQKWLMSVDSTTSASAGVRWNVYQYFADGTTSYVSASGFNTASGRRVVSYVWTVPAGVIAFYPALACNTTAVTWTVHGNAFVGQQAKATLIENGAIVTAHMTANTIDASVITAGTITAPKIAAKTITTDKLVISSSDNLIVEADFTNGGTSWGLGVNTINATAGRGSMPAMRWTGAGSTSIVSSLNLSNKVTVDADNRFRGSLYVKSTAALASASVGVILRCYTTASAFTDIDAFYNLSPLVANTWTQVSGTTPILPANTKAVEFLVWAKNNVTGTVTDVDSVTMTRAADAQLIVDGSITSLKLETDLVLATKIIAGNALGTHAEMAPTGFKVFAADALGGAPTEVVRLGVANTNDYFAITSADGEYAASISEDGKISGEELHAKTSLNYRGRELDSLLSDLPRGLRGYGDYYSLISGIGTEYGIFDVQVDVEPGRAYEITLFASVSSSTGGGGCLHLLRTADGGTAPALGSTELTRREFAFSGAAVDQFASSVLWYPSVSSTTTKRILWSVNKFGGGTANWLGGEMVIKDVGPVRLTGGTPNNGGGSTAAPVVVRQTQYGPTNSMNYKGDNTQYNFDTGRMYQGLSPAGVGNTKSIAFFNDMTSDLSGATINWIRVYFDFNHWYYNAGGTARIGVHGHTNIPGSFSSNGVVVTSGGWPKPGARWVDLPSSVFAGFKSGAYRGVTLEGDGTYGTYGYSVRPTIEINYTK